MGPVWFQVTSVLVLVVCSFILPCNAGKIRTSRQVSLCPESEQCKLLRECPTLLYKLRNDGFSAVLDIKKRLCGRKNFNAEVCCPAPLPKHPEFFPSDCGNNPVASGHIVFGDETKKGEFPWMAVFGYTGGRNDVTFMCGGSVINARYILTAAHCVHEKYLMYGRYKLSVIRLGVYKLNNEPHCYETNGFGQICDPAPLDLNVEEMVIHPKFDSSLMSNDIALIRLDQTIDFKESKGYISPICLPSQDQNVRNLGQKTDEPPIVIGYGKTEKGTYSSTLLKAKIPFASRSRCSDLFDDLFGDKQLCAGGTETDSCKGDSGSPLMLIGSHGPPFLQIGIVSFGKNGICGIDNDPAVYVSVASYRYWIANNLKTW